MGGYIIHGIVFAHYPSDKELIQALAEDRDKWYRLAIEAMRKRKG